LSEMAAPHGRAKVELPYCAAEVRDRCPRCRLHKKANGVQKQQRQRLGVFLAKKSLV
jgi:hypothetical protein